MADGDMKIVSMERTKKEKEDAEKRWSTDFAPDGPDYPYGLCLSLDEITLKKLGIEELPEIGDEFHIYAVCRVTRVSASASENGFSSQGVELQITEMGAMHEDDAEEQGDAFSKAASKLYGNAEKAEGEKG